MVGIFGLIFGIINLIFGCLSLGGADYTIFYYIYHSMKNISYFIKVHGSIPAFSLVFTYITYHVFLWSIIAIIITWMVSDGIMLYGISKKKPSFMIVWLVINMTLLVVSKNE